MAFSLYTLLKAGLLLLNALAILHPQRFLRKHGLEQPGFGSEGGLKDHLAQTLAWTRGLRSAFCCAARLRSHAPNRKRPANQLPSSLHSRPRRY